MKPKSKSQLSLLMIASLAIFSFTFIITSCKNEDKEKGKTDAKDTSTTTPAKTPESGSVNLAGNPLPFYTLQLEKASLEQLLNDPATGKPHKDIKKIIIQSIDKNTAGYVALGLVAYGAKNNNEIVTGPVDFTALPNPPSTFDGTIIMGSQEFSLKSLKDLLNAGTARGTIDPAKLVALKFVPQQDGDNHLFYVITKVAAPAAGAINSNPSPPATPCSGNGCDY